MGRSIHHVRLDNANLLLADECGGVRGEFAARVGIHSSYASDILNARRRIGEKMARQIESSFGKQIGFLDQDFYEPPSTDENTIVIDISTYQSLLTLAEIGISKLTPR